jgi:helicase
MAFHGLFVGIDRYASAGINWLACASRDARALEAQFSDTLGGQTTLLVDAEATRVRIEAEFARLSTCSEDDTVVVAFSGHGTEHHQLVTYDTDPNALATTCVALDELTDGSRRFQRAISCCCSIAVFRAALARRY